MRTTIHWIGLVAGVLMLALPGMTTAVYASNIEMVKNQSESKDMKHDVDIDDLKSKDLSKKARIKALEIAVEALQTELTNIQLLPGPAGVDGAPGPQGPAGVCQTGGQHCPIGEFAVGFDLSGNLICSTLAPPPPAAPNPPNLTSAVISPTLISDFSTPVVSVMTSLGGMTNQDCLTNFGLPCTDYFNALLGSIGFSNLKKVVLAGTAFPGGFIHPFQQNCGALPSLQTYIENFVNVQGPSPELLTYAGLLGLTGNTSGVITLLFTTGVFNTQNINVQGDGSFSGYTYVTPDVTDIATKVSTSSSPLDSSCSNTVPISLSTVP